MKLLKFSILSLVLAIALSLGACGGQVTSDGEGGEGNSSGPGTPVDPAVVFTPLGAALAFDLIDLEFLLDSEGNVEGVLVITQGGTVYYLDANFNLVATNNTAFPPLLAQSFEGGLLNVEADPAYADNKAVYFYYTGLDDNLGDPTNDEVNQVERRTLQLVGNTTLNLNDPQTIIEFPKAPNSNFPGSNHNGGGMTFDLHGNLIIGVGDGGGASSANLTELIAQDPNNPLGKIHRIVPNPTGDTNGGGFGVNNGYTLPIAPADDLNQEGFYGANSSIYVNGVRNPFSLANKDKGDQFFGDPGTSGPNAFEEMNCLYDSTENYGWPLYEGDFFDASCLPGACQPAAHGYFHSDDSFANQDPLASGGGPHAIIILAFIEGEQAYGEGFDRRVIYTDFFQGWVRALRVEVNHLKTADDQIGHQSGLTALQKNPDDLFFYGISLGGSNQILKMELAP